MKIVMIGGQPRLWDYSQQTTEQIFAQTGNTGNLAFRYAVFKHMGRNAKVLPWNSKVERVHKAGEIAVLPCANHLGPHEDCRSRAELTSQLNIPVLAIGLGAQSKSDDVFPDIPKDTIRWVQAMSERRTSSVPNITVRGEFTRRVVERMGIRDSVEVLGCPSLFISDNDHLGQDIAKRLEQLPQRIAVAAGNPARPVSTSLERELFGIAQRTGGSYIVQHPLPFIKAARGEIDEIPGVWKKKIESFVAQENYAQKQPSMPANMTVFFDVDAWMEDLRQHDFVVGLRIHGTMLAIQAGVPALCVTHDSRTEELCRTMAIPHVSARILSEGRLDLTTLLKHTDFDPVRFDANRRQLAMRYRDVLVGSGINPPESLDIIANMDEVTIAS